MTDRSEHPSSELAERLRLWIVLAGYILGGWAILQIALMLMAWGLPFKAGFRFRIMVPIHRLATAMYLVSPFLLVAGCWGFHRHRRWARTVLLTYAGTWVAAVFGMRIVQFIDTLSGTYGDLSSLAIFSMALSGIDLAVYTSVFPVLMVLCLARPEVRDQFPEFRAGFTPIIDGDQK
jgi:hypothetical protein